MRKLSLFLIGLLLSSVVFAKTEDPTSDVIPVSAYGTYNGTILPIKVSSDGTVVTSGGGGAGSNYWTLGPSNVGINTTNNVGIGSASPSQKLDVAGVIRATSDILVGSQSVCQEDGTNCPAGGTNPWLSTTGVGIGTTSNVGVGTYLPQGPLQIKESNVTYVGCTDSIETAISNATAGDTLVLGSCTYATAGNTITIAKSIGLVGQGYNSTIIDAGSSATGIIEITASNVLISGMRIIGTNTSTSVTAISADGGATQLTNVNFNDIDIDISNTASGTYGINLINTSGYAKDIRIRNYTGSGTGGEQNRSISVFGNASCTGDITYYLQDVYVESGTDSTSWNGGRMRAFMLWNNSASKCGYDMNLYVSNSVGIVNVSDVTDTSYGAEAINCQGPNAVRNYGTVGGHYCHIYNTILDGGTNHTTQTVGRTDFRCDDYAQCYLENVTLRNNNIQNINNANMYNYGSLHAQSIQNTSSVLGATPWVANIYQTGSSAIALTGQKGGGDAQTGSRTAPAGGGFNFIGGEGSSATATTLTGTGGVGGPFTFTGGVGGAQTTVTSTTNVGGKGSNVVLTSGVGGAASGASGTNTGGNGGDITFTTAAGGSGSTTNGSTGAIIFVNNATEVMRVTGGILSTSTNVGIGTAAANARLYIAQSPGTSSSTSMVLHNLDGRAWNIIATGSAGTTNTNSLIIRDATAAVNRVILDNAGNIGIGTMTPKNTFAVVGNAAIGTAANVGISAPANGLYVQGNVGIGSLTPGSKLDVQAAATGFRVFGTVSTWTVKTGANTACNTTCGTVMCAMGQEGVTLGLLACTDATADTCVCMGP